MTVDVYEALGLRGNPFTAEQEPGVADALWLDRGLPSPLDLPRPHAVQVIGARGAGKTSHLLHWARGAPYVHVPPGRGTPALPAVAPVVAWDEADRVPGARLVTALRRARRAGALVLLGTHDDLRALVRLSGLPLVSHVLAPPDAREIMAWADLRITASARRAPGIRPPGDLAATMAAAGSDWRAVGDALHAWAAAEARRTLDPA